jgi:DNA-binding CsgD family transcriptional regulator
MVDGRSVRPRRRQAEILALALAGRTNKEIAYELGVAQSTVRVIMARICARHAVAGRKELLEKLSAQLLAAASPGA